MRQDLFPLVVLNIGRRLTKVLLFCRLCAEYKIVTSRNSYEESSDTQDSYSPYGSVQMKLFRVELTVCSVPLMNHIPHWIRESLHVWMSSAPGTSGYCDRSTCRRILSSRCYRKSPNLPCLAMLSMFYFGRLFVPRISVILPSKVCLCLSGSSFRLSVEMVRGHGTVQRIPVRY